MRAFILPSMIALTLVAPAVSALPSFPGAEGFGSDTPGGRGGAVVFVDNLDDAGPGSLREALQVATGPRTVIFRVGGTIELMSDIRILAANSYVTIAGQTAPGDGIQLKNYGLVVRDGGHDVVVRYLRIRPGDTTPGIWDKDGVLVWGNSGSEVHHVIVDHASIEWAIDENVNVYDWAHDVTFQNCIFAEGSLTGHPQGAHGKGMLIANDARTTVTIQRSLFAHNDDRNPKIMDNVQGVADLRYNVIYNWGGNNATRFDTGTRVNVVGNVFVAGPSTSAGNQRVIYVPDATNATGIALYLADNVAPLCAPACSDPWAIGVWYLNGTPQDADPSLYGASAPHTAPSVTPPGDVMGEVLADVGATLPARDPVDARIVADVTAKTGAVGIGSDYPTLQTGTPPPDADEDGMPDDWELAQTLDPNNPEDRNGDLDGDGYTNLEEFLNGLTPSAPSTTSSSASSSGAGGGSSTSGAGGAASDSASSEGGCTMTYPRSSPLSWLVALLLLMTGRSAGACRTSGHATNRGRGLSGTGGGLQRREEGRRRALGER